MPDGWVETPVVAARLDNAGSGTCGAGSKGAGSDEAGSSSTHDAEGHLAEGRPYQVPLAHFGSLRAFIAFSFYFIFGVVFVGSMLRRRRTAQVLLRFPDDAVLGVLCPITLDVMKEPVIAVDGETYERAAILVRK
jgi:hypothetical protein